MTRLGIALAGAIGWAWGVLERIGRPLPWIVFLGGPSLLAYAITLATHGLFGLLTLGTVLALPLWWLLGWRTARGYYRRKFQPTGYLVGCRACGWAEVLRDPDQMGPRGAHHAEFDCPVRARGANHE